MLTKLKSLIKKNKERGKKLNYLLDSFEYIAMNGDSVIFKFDKNIVCYSDGHQLFASKKDILVKSKHIHLNPEIPMIDESEFDKTEQLVDKAHERNNEILKISKNTKVIARE